MNKQLLSTLENSRNYTMAVADAMPEEHYNFKPVDTVWNFGELIHHIAYGIEWWQDNYIKSVKTGWDPPPMKNNKKQVTAYLSAAYDALKETVGNSTAGDTAIQGLHATIDHITHHRGQAITYLRCKGVAAPEYTY
jgi:uncharacterized damage-inducible protein DinB